MGWQWRGRKTPRRRKRFTRGQLTLHIKPPRRGKEWRAARLAAEKNFCEIPRCSTFLHDQLGDGTVVRRHPTIDHIIPELFLFQHSIPDAHDPANLICVCKPCHGRKKTVEDKIFRGDRMGFLSGLRQLGWPMKRVENALKLYCL
ncbi:MAG: HNH endonuclease signature motif containing protein [Candidatus Acidiferrales bacterium]